MSRKCTARTALLMMVAVELCLLYCLVDQKTRFMWNRGDKSHVVGQDQQYGIFLYCSLASDVVAMLGAAVIVISSTVKWFNLKKIFVVIVFAVNFIAVLPLQISGFVLYFSTLPANRVSVSVGLQNSFNDFFISPNDTALPEELASLQDDNCCCGLNNQADYQTKAANTTVFCPEKSKCPHKHGKFLGCGQAVPGKLRLFILISSCIGLFCSLLAMAITPFIYAYFEKDRREGRAQYLRDWQQMIHKEMEQKRLLFVEEQQSKGPGKTSTTTSSSEK